MPSTSEKQARFWVFKKHDPNSTDEERKVAEEFIEADKKEGKWSMYKKDKNNIEDSKEELLWELESIYLEEELTEIEIFNYILESIEIDDIGLEADDIKQNLNSIHRQLKITMNGHSELVSKLEKELNAEGKVKLKAILVKLAASAGGLIAVAAAAKLIRNIVKKYRAKKTDKEEISKEELDIILESLNDGKDLSEIYSNEELIESFSVEGIDDETMSSLLFDAGKKLGTSVFKISRKILSNIFKELFNSNKDISLDISRKYNIDPDLAEKLYTDVFNNNIKIRALRRLGYLLGGTTLLTGGILLHNKLKEDDKHNY